MEKMRVSADYLTREEQQRLLGIYRDNDVRRWRSSNAGTKTCDNGVMFFSYYTCLCIVHSASENNSIEFMPYVYAHSAFVNSRTANRHLHKFLLANHVNTSLAHIADMYDNLCNGLRVPCLRTTNGVPIDVQFSPRWIYLKASVIYDGNITFKVPHVIITHDGTECVGIYERA